MNFLQGAECEQDLCENVSCGNGVCVAGTCDCDFGYINVDNVCVETCASKPCKVLPLAICRYHIYLCDKSSRIRGPRNGVDHKIKHFACERDCFPCLVEVVVEDF